MKRWIVLSLLLVPLLASAAGFWDGNAALQRGDSTFEGGLNVESNSFPPGSQITIQNQDTGKSVTATVTGRIEGQSDILVLISPKAADALGLSQGTLGRVRVTVPPRAGSTADAQPGDQTVSSDPDLNPAAAYNSTDKTQVAAAPQSAATEPASAATNPTAETSTPSVETLPSATPTATTPEAATTPAATPEAPAAETATTPATTPEATTTPATTTEAPAAETATTPATTPEATTTPATTPATTTEATTTPATTPETATTPASSMATTTPTSPDADNAAILSAAQARTPQKQVFQPPREDEKFVYKKPVTVPPQAVAVTTPETTQPGGPTITAVVGEPGVTPAVTPSADLALADVTAPQESRPEEIVGAGTAVPAPAAEAPQVTLAAPEPTPEGQAAAAPVQTEVTGPAAVPPAGPGTPKLALVAPEAPAPAQVAAAIPQTTTPQTTTPQTTTPRVTTTATATTTTAAAATTPPPAAVQTAAALPRTTGSNTYFLQLAAYGAEKNARDLAAKLSPTYPALVLAPSNPGSTVFKVIIGPLNRAESGTLLTWFRYRGFPDAFLKQE